MIRLQEPYRSDKTLAAKVTSSIEYTALANLVRSSQIVYDPDPSNTVIPADEEMLFG